MSTTTPRRSTYQASDSSTRIVPRWDRIAGLAAVAMTVAGMGLFILMGLHGMQYENGGPAARTLPPCATEDSDGCYWDAGERGNGSGASFVVIDGTTYYLGGE